MAERHECGDQPGHPAKPTPFMARPSAACSANGLLHSPRNLLALGVALVQHEATETEEEIGRP